MSTYKMYNKKQLRAIAEKLLQEYRQKAKLFPGSEFDVYDVIEKCLRIEPGSDKVNEYDWKYLSLDGSVLGKTIFQDGDTKVYEDKYGNRTDYPQPLSVNKGIIIIDRTLAEKGPKGRENFTVMHEAFHWLLHRSFFRPLGHSVTVAKRMDKFLTREPHKRFTTPLEAVEWQANYAAACFLMPENEVVEAFNKTYTLTNGSFVHKTLIKDIIKVLAPPFHVTPEAMLYRVEELKGNGMIEGQATRGRNGCGKQKDARRG